MTLRCGGATFSVEGALRSLMLYSMRLVLLSMLLAGLPQLALAQGDGAHPNAGATETSEAEPAEPSAEELEEARQLFADGVRYAGEGEFGRAVVAFRRAAEIKAAPAVLYNLASALYEAGELPEAAARARAVVEADDAPADLQGRAQALIDDIRGRTATLTIRLGGQADGAIVDGVVLEPAALAHPLTLEPGTHTIVGLRRGEEMTHRELNIPAGGQAHVDVSVIPTPEEVAAANPPSSDEADAPARDPKLWLYVGIGGGALAVILAVVIIVAVTSGGTEDPVEGDFQPGVLRW